jgi:hypothetical protein
MVNDIFLKHAFIIGEAVIFFSMIAGIIVPTRQLIDRIFSFVFLPAVVFLVLVITAAVW